MKKFLVIALASFVALAACTKVDKKDSSKEAPLTFKVVNYLQQTKANTAYTGEAFGTFAFWTGTDWATDGDANVFMNNDKIIQNPTYAPEGEWGPESARYWTKTGKITFASYSPYTDGTDNGFSEVPAFSKTNGFVFRNFTIDATGTIDLMVADLVVDQTKNNPQYQLSGNKDGVPTLFRHVLSQIAFKFQTVENPNPNVEDTQIVINSVTVQNVYNQGTYTQNNNDVWSGESGDATYEYNPATGSPITVEPGDNPQGTDVDSMILLPQELEEGVQQIVIDYTIRTKYESNDEWAEENVTATIDLVTDEIDEWEPNQSIVYTITINPVDVNNPILFDPAVADWEVVNTEAVTL